MTLKNNDKIQFAIVGPGNISHRFLKGLKDVEEAEVLAFSSRNPSHVKEYAETEGVKKVYRFEDLLKDEEVNAVYVSTPPSVHYEEITALLKAGKNVLCEKPLCKNGHQAEELYNLAKENHVILMEAQKNVFTPVFHQIQQWLQEDKIGTVYSMDASFVRTGDSNSAYPMSHGSCSDVPYEIGGYPLSELMVLTGKIDEIHPEYIWREDSIVSAVYFMKSGDITMTANASGLYDRPCMLHIYGTLGRIETENFWKTHEVILILNHGETETKKFEFNSEFTFEIQEFAECIRNRQSFSSIWTPDYSIQMLDIIAGKENR